jgi:hypothetical protein
VILGTAIASSSSTSSAPGKLTIRDTRAVVARGRIALNRGRGRAQGRGSRGGIVLVAKIGIDDATIDKIQLPNLPLMNGSYWRIGGTRSTALILPRNKHSIHPTILFL